MVPEKYKKILIAIIKKHLPEAKIYLFGSRAQKTHSSRSDIDIALDAKNQLPLTVLGNIKDDIRESIIPYFVDIVDLHDSSDSLQQQILSHGIAW